MKSTIPLASVAAICLSLWTPPVCYSATIVWNGAGDGSTWGDDNNWVGGTRPSGADSPQLDGATVVVDTAESYTGFEATGPDGQVIVNSGGELTANSSFNALRRISAMTVNTGGRLIADPTVDIRSGTLTINAGGEVTGTDSIFDGDTLTIGGIFRPMDTIDGNNEFRIGSPTTGGHVEMAATGTLYLDLFGDGTNEFFNINDRDAIVSSLDLSVGSIVLSPQGGYMPQVGHSYDLWDDAQTGMVANDVTPGTGANISLTGYQLDLSLWQTQGVVTVTAIPEPSGILVIGFGALALFMGRRRR